SVPGIGVPASDLDYVSCPQNGSVSIGRRRHLSPHPRRPAGWPGIAVTPRRSESESPPPGRALGRRAHVEFADFRVCRARLRPPASFAVAEATFAPGLRHVVPRDAAPDTA